MVRCNTWLIAVGLAGCSLFDSSEVEAFSGPSLRHNNYYYGGGLSRIVAAGGGGVVPSSLLVLDAKKKKRRRRKRKEDTTEEAPASQASSSAVPNTPPPAPAVPPPAAATVVATTTQDFSRGIEDRNVQKEELSKEEMFQLEDVANFKFDKDAMKMDGPIPVEADSFVNQDQQQVPVSKSDAALPLPDIRQALQMKQDKEEQARIEEEEERNRVKIKRTDKEAFLKLLEQQPYADADDSFFEQEEYGTVSALLAEGSKPFLSIPPGPLQVGHFIGALGIILCAFVDYPGFPLTNLPTPIRDALQGGLLAVFLINTVLAVLAAFQAGRRGQPLLLWAVKTFSVGGLAYDQLTQLPTLEEIEKQKRQQPRF